METRMKQNYQITKWCHRFITDAVQEGDTCIDATAGNGNDTELLCRLSGHTGKVYAFDIQQKALEVTRERLQKKGYHAQLILAGHEHMDEYVEERDISCIVFNFGYLPGGRHDQATQPQSSIAAIEKGLKMLKKDGLMSLCIYSGGDSGFKEKEEILTYLKTLDAKKYLVIVSHYLNRPNHPPIPALIIKLVENITE